MRNLDNVTVAGELTGGSFKRKGGKGFNYDSTHLISRSVRGGVTFVCAGSLNNFMFRGGTLNNFPPVSGVVCITFQKQG